MYKRLYNIIDYHNVLHPQQFGFRKQCSTKREPILNLSLRIFPIVNNLCL